MYISKPDLHPQLYLLGYPSFLITDFAFLLNSAVADEDDVLIVDSDEEPSSSTMDVSTETNSLKRKIQDTDASEAAPKRKRLGQQPVENDDDDIIALD